MSAWPVVGAQRKPTPVAANSRSVGAQACWADVEDVLGKVAQGQRVFVERRNSFDVQQRSLPGPSRECPGARHAAEAGPALGLGVGEGWADGHSH